MIKDLPERATSKGIVAPGFHPGEGGVNPTVALQTRTGLNCRLQIDDDFELGRVARREDRPAWYV
jgi:hypothetical protein